MAYVEWRPALEVGQGKLDGDHRSLVDVLNRLHAAREQGQGKAEIEQVLVFLREYVVTHFRTEESLMIQHRYPGAAQHFAAHVDLVMKLSDLLTEYRAGRAELTDAVLGFLESWLVDHILGPDKELGVYLRSRGSAA